MHVTVGEHKPLLCANNLKGKNGTFRATVDNTSIPKISKTLQSA
jgi:hypothetical protein